MDICYLETLQGVAFYDSRGLPQRLFTVTEQSIYWTEQTFYALGLQKIISQYLDLPRLDYGTLTTKAYRILLVRQEDSFVACIQGHDGFDQGEVIKWLQGLSVQRIESHPRFLNL